jgi:hypothetical protein
MLPHPHAWEFLFRDTHKYKTQVRGRGDDWAPRALGYGGILHNLLPAVDNLFCDEYARWVGMCYVTLMCLSFHTCRCIHTHIPASERASRRTGYSGYSVPLDWIGNSFLEILLVHQGPIVSRRSGAANERWM